MKMVLQGKTSKISLHTLPTSASHIRLLRLGERGVVERSESID